MEEELGRPVSLGEVFLRTHTRADGTFVDDKAKLIAEAYKKNLQERISEMDADDMDDASSEQPTTLPLSIEERNELFLQSTETDKKGNIFGLGSLVETLEKGNGKESYGSSDTTILEMKSQLETANRKIAEHEADNARRDEEQRVTKERMEMFIAIMKIHNPSLASLMDTQRPETTPATAPSTSPDQT
ncbi:hypothetical protein Bca101_026482 [Brassica carinata]